MKKKPGKKAKDITIDLPEVKDIPGQEHVRPPYMREMMDSTASSADEEGEGLLDDPNEEQEPLTDGKTNVTKAERDLIKKADRPVTDEDRDLQEMELDETDEEDPLNERSDPKDMGEDLDVPGSELDDEDEDLGEEDEENNTYSGRD
ncbi:MAG TPA: hypothetical protein VHN59_01415 [Chitinophagaceae bacterium]|nr:hypothetical protein [Chitinophagaceae bacterium]